MRFLKKIVRREVAVNSTLWGDDLHPLIKQIYTARGVENKEAFSRELKNLLPVSLLKNSGAASELLADAIEKQQRVLIVGDFDVDGATSTTIAVRCLKAFGLQQIDYLVPNRFNFGYGLTPKLVEVAKEMKPDLIVTVDNGISSFEGIEAAKEAGIKVLVTDHHLSAAILPAADVIVNPNQSTCQFPSKSLAGVGVIYYVMIALRSELKKRNWFAGQNIAEPNMANFLDIVALGTVADVVPLDQNNRLLVHHGLRRIRAGKCVAGIKAILEVAGRDIKNCKASDLGFAVGPRLNAAGRMDDMSIGIECLLSDDENQARVLASELDQFNKERKHVEDDMQQQALEHLKKMRFEKETLPHGLALYDKNWHQGVIGILASRIKDRLHRPVAAFAMDDENTLKGSVRSIPGVHIRDVLANIDAKHPGLIIKFGGHAMAAGLSLVAKEFQRFKTLFDLEVANVVDETMLEGIIESDGMLGAEDLTLRFAEIIEEAGPWGQQFPEPLFDGKFTVINHRLLGGKHLKLTLSPKGSDLLLDAIAFNIDTNQWPGDSCHTIQVAYRLDINEFRSFRKVQLMIEQFEAVAAVAAAL